ncbi:MAG: type II toxin-antitoxin system VapC family toxin [Pseudonocardia sp.]
MKVVVDSHALLFYLFTPDQLSDPALEALGEAENTDGIVVSTATIGGLWYTSHKQGRRALTPGAFESLRRTVLDPDEKFNVVAIDAATMDHFERVPLEDLGDPFDRFILATAAQLQLPLVTKDRAITATRLVEVIW